MAMTVGSVVVDDTGTATTQTGCAGEIYAQLLLMVPAINPPGGAVPPNEEGVPMKRGFAQLAIALSTAIIGHIQTNADVVIPATPAGDGIQRDADGANPNCLGPIAQKTLAGAID